MTALLLNPHPRDVSSNHMLVSALLAPLQISSMQDHCVAMKDQ
jgi:hypothetical protein